MRYQESETVELKQDFSENIRKEIIAFANSRGGKIYIGVLDNGEVIGVPSADQMIQRIANTVRDSIKPDVTMFVHYEPVTADDKQIVEVSVNQGTGRPYYLGEKGMRPSGVFVRQGTVSAPATEAAIRQMIRETDGDSYEDRRSLSQELRFDYASSVFEKQHLDLGIPQMKTLGIMTADGIYTNLGLLLSDQCPPIIKAAAFSGTDQDAFQNRREFGGSLLKQVDDAYAFLDMQNEKSATFDGLRRTDHRAYPEAALREALLNAVVHRDYSYAASTLISTYADRIEIVSVGGLITGFSLADVIAGLSICRNPKLANVFYRLDLIEAYGTGLKKIMSAYSGVAAETLFQVTENVFKATLPRKASIGMKPQQLQATNEEKILTLFASSETITRADVEQLTGLSTASASRLLHKMVEGGKLAVTGAGKNTRYYVP